MDRHGRGYGLTFARSARNAAQRNAVNFMSKIKETGKGTLARTQLPPSSARS